MTTWLRPGHDERPAKRRGRPAFGDQHDMHVGADHDVMPPCADGDAMPASADGDGMPAFAGEDGMLARANRDGEARQAGAFCVLSFNKRNTRAFDRSPRVALPRRMPRAVPLAAPAPM
jgi:hypothetical protein